MTLSAVPSTKWYTGTTCGWSRLARMRASVRSPSVPLLPSLASTSTATSRPRAACRAENTTPPPPRPSLGPSANPGSTASTSARSKITTMGSWPRESSPCHRPRTDASDKPASPPMVSAPPAAVQVITLCPPPRSDGHYGQVSLAASHGRQVHAGRAEGSDPRKWARAYRRTTGVRAWRYPRSRRPSVDPFCEIVVDPAEGRHRYGPGPDEAHRFASGVRLPTSPRSDAPALARRPGYAGRHGMLLASLSTTASLELCTDGTRVTPHANHRTFSE